MGNSRGQLPLGIIGTGPLVGPPAFTSVPSSGAGVGVLGAGEDVLGSVDGNLGEVAGVLGAGGVGFASSERVMG